MTADQRAQIEVDYVLKEEVEQKQRAKREKLGIYNTNQDLNLVFRLAPN